MKLFTGWAMWAGLVLAASAAQAQGLAPNDPARPRYQATSDVAGPYGAMPMEAPPPRYGYGPAYGYGPPPAYSYGPSLMPPVEVYTVLRENGFSPLGIPHQRGRVYVISVLDRSGEDGRLIIDARDGHIIRFVPAFRSGGGYYDNDYPPPYGGPVPPADIRGGLQPPASGTRMASRSVPLPAPKPKQAALASVPQAEPAKPAAAVIEPKQQSAAVVEKAAEAPAPAAVPAAPPAPVEAKPTPVIQPTRDMPKVQGLE